jgi:hypothetical protein
MDRTPETHDEAVTLTSALPVADREHYEHCEHEKARRWRIEPGAYVDQCQRPLEKFAGLMGQNACAPQIRSRKPLRHND